MGRRIKTLTHLSDRGYYTLRIWWKDNYHYPLTIVPALVLFPVLSFVRALMLYSSSIRCYYSSDSASVTVALAQRCYYHQCQSHQQR